MILITFLPLMFALTSSDRVVFYGDSITEQRLYTTYVEVFVRTRYPTLKTEFFNAGVGGDATWGGWTGDPKTRVARDVAPHKPTRITIMLGMNDGGYVPYSQRIYDIFVEWYDKLLNLMTETAPAAKFTLIRTSPFDDFTGRPSQFKGYNETLLRFGGHVESLAKKRGDGYVDFNEPLADAIKKAHADNPSIAEAMLPDQIHPGPSGHLIMAAQLLKSWGAGAVVSSVEIDAKSGDAVQQINTQVTNLHNLSWQQLDKALPFPVDGAMAPATQYSNFQKTLNQQILRVTHLQPGRYELLIDDQSVGKWNSDALAEGVNLSSSTTPMLKQALNVLDLATKRNETAHTARFQIGFSLAEFKAATGARSALEKLGREIGEKEHLAAQPTPHRFKLIRSS